MELIRCTTIAELAKECSSEINYFDSFIKAVSLSAMFYSGKSKT